LSLLSRKISVFLQETSPPSIPPLHKYVENPAKGGGEGFTLHFVSRRRRDVEGKGFTLKEIQGER
jgi:hypothetical protein